MHESLFEEYEPDEDNTVLSDASVMMDEARKLVSKWLPWGVEREKSQGSWAIGTGISVSEFEGKQWLWVWSQNKQGLGTKFLLPDSIDQLWAMGISFLVYAAVEEARKEITHNA